MDKFLRISIYLFLLIALLLNIFVFDLTDGYYYIFNSFVFTFFVVSVFLIRSKYSVQSNTEKKVLKVIVLLSSISFLAQVGSISILHSYNYRDLSILIFSIANLIAFFVIVFMYEIRN